MTNASSHGKTGVQVSTRRQGTRIGWRDVLAAVQDSAERSSLVGSLSASGFSIDEFANLTKAREIACSWLSRYEDRLESRTGKLRAAERESVRGVRRRLECELHP